MSQIIAGKSHELAVRRAEYLKKLKLKISSSQKTSDHDQLILIETYDMEKSCSVELVMRRLSELDSLISHLNRQYGGHIIPTFSFDLYYQSEFDLAELMPAIREYFHDLKHNKYCRQDSKLYCFLIEQHASFPKQMGLERALLNATSVSKKYLNQVFTRKAVPQQTSTDTLLYSWKELEGRIEQYLEIKTISLLKVQEILLFEEATHIFVQLSACPCLAIEPQEPDIDFISKTVKSAEKLIEQARAAYLRWEALVDSVRELQGNVYKGLHEYEPQLREKNEQLGHWSESLTREFNQLIAYLEEKMEALAMEIYKVNSKLVDMTVFAGQAMQIQSQNQKIEQQKQKTNQPKFELYQQVQQIDSTQAVKLKLRPEQETQPEATVLGRPTQIICNQ